MSLVRTGTISTSDQRVNQKKYDENYERIFGKFKPSGLSRTKNVVKDKHSNLDDSDSSISQMMRDKTMVRMIRSGKANDPGLKREAERIERENSTRPREIHRQKQQAQLAQLKHELRRSQR